MRIGNCSVLIPEGRERGSGHVHLNHDTVYTVKLSNHWQDRQCDAEVSIDGKSVGCFRLERGGSVTLERGIGDSGRFTFLKADSADAADAGVDQIGKCDRGLVVVKFHVGRKPEPKPVTEKVYVPYPVYPPYPPPTEWTSPPRRYHWYIGGAGGSVNYASVAPPEVSAGITGLTGYSNQEFISCSSIEYDLSEETTINLRLVCDESAPKRVRPLVEQCGRSNQVPDAV